MKEQGTHSEGVYGNQKGLHPMLPGLELACWCHSCWNFGDLEGGGETYHSHHSILHTISPSSVTCEQRSGLQVPEDQCPWP